MILHIGFNKGGTKKTTLALMLALYFVEQDKKVALVDLDGQGDLSRYLGLSEKYKGEGVDKLFTQTLSGESDFPLLPVTTWGCRGNTDNKLFYIPALHGSIADINKKATESYVKNFIGNVKKLYEAFDIIILDTPPSLTITQMASLAVAHDAIIPLNADFNGCGLEKVKQYFSLYTSVKRKYNPQLSAPAVVLTAVDAKGKQAKNYVSWAQSFFGNRLATRYIKHSAAVPNALLENRAVWFKAVSGNDRAEGSTYRLVLEELVKILEEGK